jgi:hypothetical protein
MKKIIIATILGFLVMSISAQTTFFKWYPSDHSEYIVNAHENINGSFILSGSRTQSEYNSSNAYLLKIDSNGFYISDNEVLTMDTSSCFTVSFMLPNESNFIYYVNSKNWTEINGLVKHSISFEKVNTQNLFITEMKGYNTSQNRIIAPQRVLVVDTNIFLLSNYSQYNPNHQILGNIISKYNFNFDSLATFIDLRPTVYDAGIINNVAENSIKCLYGVPGTLHLLELDYELALIENKNLASIFYNAGCITPLGSKYIFTGTTREIVNVNDHIKVIRLNMSDEIIDSISIYNNPDSVLYAGSVTNTAVVGNQIFVVGNYHFNPSQFPWQSHPTCIQITIMDTSLNIIGHHFYGGDAVYMPYKIISTSDGGALIVGNRYDHTNPSVRVYHPFALKINNQGLVVAEIEHQDYPISYSAIVFPNPGKEILHLTSGIQINNGIFTLYDMRGRPVLTKEIIATEMQFDTSNLASGMYVWRIVKNNKVMDSGKWVKK